MYFDYGFHQFYMGAVTGGALNLTTSGTTANLSAGQIGLFLNNNGNTGLPAIASGTTQQIMLGSGSWHTVDSISTTWGGLQEPVNSKGINPRLVTKFAKFTAVAAQNQVLSIGWNQSSGSSVGPVFYCGTSYYLKVQANGLPALEFLNKQMYNNLDAWGGCCGTDCSSGCTSTAVDAAYIMLQWKDRITQNPYLTQFYTPAVYIKDGSSKTEVYSAYDETLNPAHTAYVPNTADPTSVIACLQLTVAYVETTFAKCTFTPTDMYTIEPLIVQASLVTQDFTECAWNTTMGTQESTMSTEIQTPRQTRGYGQSMVRNWILSNRYRQDNFPNGPWADQLRMREIEDEVALPNTTLTGLYDMILIMHNISRPYNPTGLHNNDQYALWIAVPSGTDTTAFTDLFQSCLTLAGSNVTLESY